MRIGLDIDNVILDTDEIIFKKMLKIDKTKRNKGIINKDAYLLNGMFDWEKEEINEFLNIYMEDIAKRLIPKKDAKKYIDLLLSDNNEIYLVSNRNSNQYKNAYETTINNLKENNINYTKLIITETNDKSNACIDNNIDIMIDDRPSNCIKLTNKNIKCILFKSKYEKRTFNEFDSVLSWKELYEKLKGEYYENN